MSKKAAARSGSTRLRPDGRWEGRVRLGNGKRKSFFGPTEEAVRKAMTAEVAAYDRGLPVADGSLRLGAWLDYWLENIIRPERRPRTTEAYGLVIKNHLAPSLGRVPIVKLSQAHIRGFLKEKREAGFRQGTVKNMHNILTRALKDAQREDRVSRNVASLVSCPKGERQTVRCFDEGQALAFLDAIVGHPFEPYFLVVLSLGLRRGEGAGLRWADLDFDRHEIHVERCLQRVPNDEEPAEGEEPRKTKLSLGPVKTHRSRRPLPMSPRAEAALKRQSTRQKEAKLFAGKRWKNDDDLVFTTAIGTPIEPARINQVLADICAAEQNRAAAEEREPAFPVISPHGLRHSMVTLLRAQGVSDSTIAQLAGHAHVSTTTDIYGKVVDTLVRGAASVMESILTRKA